MALSSRADRKGRCLDLLQLAAPVAHNDSGDRRGMGATLGGHFPAMTPAQVSALIDPNAKVEIEAEAILP